MSTVAEAPAALERLWCETGEHYFERPVIRGVKPVACDEHKAEYRRREQQRRRGKAVPPVTARVVRGDAPPVLLDPIYGHVADASIAFHTGDAHKMIAALRRLAAAAELLALSVPSDASS